MTNNNNNNNLLRKYFLFFIIFKAVILCEALLRHRISGNGTIYLALWRCRPQDEEIVGSALSGIQFTVVIFLECAKDALSKKLKSIPVYKRVETNHHLA